MNRTTLLGLVALALLLLTAPLARAQVVADVDYLPVNLAADYEVRYLAPPLTDQVCLFDVSADGTAPLDLAGNPMPLEAIDAAQAIPGTCHAPVHTDFATENVRAVLLVNPTGDKLFAAVGFRILAGQPLNSPLSNLGQFLVRPRAIQLASGDFDGEGAA